LEPTQLPQQRASRLASLACGGALAVAAVVVAANDPSAAGSHFPGCTFHALTGWWCPGCGLTRGTHHLLHGEVVAALGSNVFTPFVLVAIAATWWVWLSRSFGTQPEWASKVLRWFLDRAPRWIGPGLLVIVVAYGLVRNIGVAPFDVLAP
jgi:Protein of unknown function (DUF2752)